MHDTLPTIRTFQYQLQDVRVVEVNGEAWFNEVDVKRALGLSSRYHGYRLLDSEKGHCIFDTLGGPQRMNIVSETGLYKLIMRSNKEEAEPFQSWVVNIIKEIRNTGRYEMPGRAAEHPPLPDQEVHALELATRLVAVEINLHDLFGIPRIHALQEGVKRVQRTLGLDMSEYLQLTPHADALPAVDEFLEIAELSLRYDFRRGVLNQWLERYGYQRRLGDGSYEPTEYAQREGLCYRHAWAKGTKSGMNMKWRVTFIDDHIERIRQYAESSF